MTLGFKKEKPGRFDGIVLLDREKLPATSLREALRTLADLGGEGLVFQIRQIDFDIGQGSGDSCPGQCDGGKQVGLHVRVGDGLERLSDLDDGMRLDRKSVV